MKLQPDPPDDWALHPSPIEIYMGAIAPTNSRPSINIQRSQP
jgi:hypothetical protein